MPLGRLNEVLHKAKGWNFVFDALGRLNEVLQKTRNLHEDATPQLSCASEASTDVSSNRRITGKSGAHPSISSPYIHLSTCYAGKVMNEY